MRNTILKDFTTTFHNFGRDEKITKWKSDKAIDKLIYKKLKYIRKITIKWVAVSRSVIY